MDKAKKALTVDEYLAVLPVDVNRTLSRLRQTIRAAAPQAEEVMSYQIPTYKYKGALLHFAAFKNHCGLYVVNKDILTMFAQELDGYNTSGTTIHFTPAKPIPLGLVKKIVTMRLEQNDAL
ncbi:DUF1801 domain-containing protein [Mucilaginibacter hurinus]|uniref:DUF1801 domain-containing protein n=1 Tax=Mucilaginibacter hurinus TaxID=2201324 RepID=A0A367GRZ1_9SPHI|nr:DUF1801 domain-containing protein [Mucilaginibacter hurinus]RCH56209.1 DUF1801 domain-containing protein [Mucilaginibacter hurinus]